MKTFKIKSAQGDVEINRIDEIPSDVSIEPMEVCDKHGFQSFILTHSESGHDHALVLDNPNDVKAFRVNEGSLANMFMYLDVVKESALRHMRDFDTHKPILIPPGKYEIRRQREYRPEGWVPALD